MASDVKKANLEKLITDIISSSERSYLKLNKEINTHEIITEKEIVYEKSLTWEYKLWPLEDMSIKTIYIMLIGETGKGKTTMINAILNFLLGITCYNVYRFTVPISSSHLDKCNFESQTEEITLYNIPYVDGMRYMNNFVVIDTPGLLDTHGQESQLEQLKQIHYFLENYSYKDTLHLGIVAEANLTINNGVKMLVDVIQDIIGELPNVKIIVIATFADITEPSCFSVLESLNIKVDTTFKINNGIIFSDFNLITEEILEEWQKWEMQMMQLLDYLIQPSQLEPGFGALGTGMIKFFKPRNSTGSQLNRWPSTSTIGSFHSAISTFENQVSLTNIIHMKRQKEKILMDVMDLSIKSAVDMYKLELSLQHLNTISLEKHNQAKSNALTLFNFFNSHSSNVIGQLTGELTKYTENLAHEIETIFESSRKVQSISTDSINKNKELSSDLVSAIKNDDESSVSSALNVGEDPNTKDEFGCPGLVLSASLSSIGIIQMLLKGGASVNDLDNNGMQAVHWAAYSGRLDVLDLLIQHSANIRVQDKYFRTPLHYAASENQRMMCEWLMTHGAEPDLSIEDAFGRTPIVRAEYRGHTKLSLWLLQIKEFGNKLDGYHFKMKELNRLKLDFDFINEENKILKDELKRFMALQEEHGSMGLRIAELENDLSMVAEKKSNLQQDFKKERLLRKYYNLIEEIKGKIRVFCRVRPLSDSELQIEENNAVTEVINEYCLKLEKRSFWFDRVFEENEDQSMVFKDICALIQSSLDGYNVTIMAYGQTGSGKTYTMIGTKDDPGIAPRSFKRIFELVEENCHKYEVHVSTYMVELYNDTLLDLINPNYSSKNKGPKIKHSKKNVAYVDGATIKNVSSEEELAQVFNKGLENRHISETQMNVQSSRSHLIIAVCLTVTSRETQIKVNGKLTLVDLAGSERLKKIRPTAEQFSELKFINKSLSALGDVIRGLSSNRTFIPYRNSKLTMLLQDSLGGNAKTLVFVHASPSAYNMAETESTLMYASRIKKITNTVDKKSDKKDKEIERLKKIIQDIKDGVHLDDETITA